MVPLAAFSALRLLLLVHQMTSASVSTCCRRFRGLCAFGRAVELAVAEGLLATDMLEGEVRIPHRPHHHRTSAMAHLLKGERNRNDEPRPR